MKEKLEKAINEFLDESGSSFDDFKTDIECGYDNNLASLTRWLENYGKGLISYNIEERSVEGDYWLQAELGGEIAGRYVGIIFDYDVTIRTETLDEFIEDLIGYEKIAQKIIKELKRLK